MRWAAVTTLIVAVGATLMVGGLLLALAARPRRAPELLAVMLPGLLALGWAAASEAPCQTQTRYYCASVRVDPDRPSGRTLVLDDLRHSYVDLADPSHLEFWYVRRLVDAIEANVAAGPMRGGVRGRRWAHDPAATCAPRGPAVPRRCTRSTATWSTWCVRASASSTAPT